MFGRLDENTDIEREYMIVSNYIDEDPVVFNIQATPEAARQLIAYEIECYKGIGFAIYELVEFAEVTQEGKVEFTEDWAGKGLDDVQTES